jgi:hypothetical protein
LAEYNKLLEGRLEGEERRLKEVNEEMGKYRDEE